MTNCVQLMIYFLGLALGVIGIVINLFAIIRPVAGGLIKPFQWILLTLSAGAFSYFATQIILVMLNRP